MFKVIYYFVSVLNWRRTYAGWKRHRFNIRDMGPLQRRDDPQGGLTLACPPALVAICPDHPLEKTL